MILRNLKLRHDLSPPRDYTSGHSLLVRRKQQGKILMYYDLEQKIEDYSEELFSDLGLATLTEDDKADLYARVQDHLHRVIVEILRPLLPGKEVAKIKQSVDEEDYHALDQTLSAFPQYKDTMEAKIDEEFEKLKLTISEEQRHGGATID